jgi:NhaP-type Na+/H+ or K+/H+ antiporter
VAADRAVGDVTAAPRTPREVAVLTWCGMRGLATLALALSLPTTTADGADFPVRAEAAGNRASTRRPRTAR